MVELCDGAAIALRCEHGKNENNDNDGEAKVHVLVIGRGSELGHDSAGVPGCHGGTDSKAGSGAQRGSLERVTVQVGVNVPVKKRTRDDCSKIGSNGSIGPRLERM